MLKRIAVVVLLAVAVAGCGGPGGRCGLFDKGYPLCGV
jgi:hypothetical protein